MATRPAAAAREITQTRSIPWTLLSYLAIGLAALLPRVLDLGVFLTGDEANFWLRRSGAFMRALQSGDFAATAISTHPGVTTMWLGSAGLLLQDMLLGSSIVRDGSFATFLALTRLPTALVHVAAIVIGYHLLRRLLPAWPAALAGLLWATDPFVIGYSRVLHVDALAGSFATLSLLAACLYWHHDRRRADLILSGFCAGLAILSKSPALAVVPVVGLIALAAFRRPTTDNGWNNSEHEGQDRRQETGDRRQEIRNLASRVSRLASRVSAVVGGRWSVVALLAWGLIAGATIFALWPALWVGPLQAYAQLRLGVEAEGAEPHMLGNFFLGREDDAPGLLFYPAVLALRATPWALLGLLALPLALRRASPATRRDIVALAGFVLLFVVALSLFPKKFNRYLIPAWPAVDILAAIGIYDLRFTIYDLLKRIPIVNRKSEIVNRLVVLVVALAAVLNAAWYHPYGIAYFNQALGGARAGERAFLVGWGEGFEQVAAWLNQQPDITGVVTVSPMSSSLQPYMRRRAQVSGPDGDALPRKAGYVVVYIRQVQDGRTVPPFDQFYGRAVPLRTVSIHGVDYAWIYQAPPPVAQPRPADFGPLLRLRGFDLGGPAQRGRALDLKLAWQVNGPPPADVVLFAHLLGPGGRRYTQADLPYPTRQWQPGRYISADLPLALPADLPPGDYRLVIGLYDPATQQRLPLAAADRLDPAIDGPDALLLTDLRIQ